MPNQYKAGTTALMLRIDIAQKRRVEAAASAAGMTISDLCRTAIFAYVDLLEKAAKPKRDL